MILSKASTPQSVNQSGILNAEGQQRKVKIGGGGGRLPMTCLDRKFCAGDAGLSFAQTQFIVLPGRLDQCGSTAGSKIDATRWPHSRDASATKRFL